MKLQKRGIGVGAEKLAWERPKINPSRLLLLGRLACPILVEYSRGMEHHVYFWLKEDHQTAADIAAFEAGLATLCTSPNIAQSAWGRPAATAERPVTDHSWSYGISLKFLSMESHDRYQEGDVIHDEFIATFKEWWAKVLVMDLA